MVGYITRHGELYDPPCRVIKCVGKGKSIPYRWKENFPRGKVLYKKSCPTLMDEAARIKCYQINHELLRYHLSGSESMYFRSDKS